MTWLLIETQHSSFDQLRLRQLLIESKHSAFNQVRLRRLMINDKHHMAPSSWGQFGTGSILTKYSTMKSVLQDVHGDCGGIFVSSEVWHIRCPFWSLRGGQEPRWGCNNSAIVATSIALKIWQPSVALLNCALQTSISQAGCSGGADGDSAILNKSAVIHWHICCQWCFVLQTAQC